MNNYDEIDPHADVKVRYNNRNILMVSEIKNAGFEYVTHIAFAYHPETKKIYGGDDSIRALTKTYLLGVCDAKSVTYDIDPSIKAQVISKMKELDMYWVNQVYLGEIFIPEGKPNERKHHMFCRGKVNNKI